MRGLLQTARLRVVPMPHLLGITPLSNPGTNAARGPVRPLATERAPEDEAIDEETWEGLNSSKSSARLFQDYRANGPN